MPVNAYLPLMRPVRLFLFMKIIKMFKVNMSKAYMASECGTRWMTSVPSNDVYYYSETLEERDIELPEGFEYNAESHTFWKGDTNYELVNENDGSVLLVSVNDIVEWFK